MPSPASAKPKKKAPPSALNKGYLIVYNAVSAVLWSVVLGRALTTYSLRGPQFVYIVVGEWTKWTQTMAGMEILHSLFGIVRAPVFTTVMQVSSRFLLVWAIVDFFPYLAFSPIYTSMLFAWSVTEVIRYSYFAFSLAGFQPRPLTWLRYNTFFVLYPIGISSECFLIWNAIKPAQRAVQWFGWLLYAVLVIYVPGSYVLYTYMMKQRRIVMRKLRAEGQKTSK